MLHLLPEVTVLDESPAEIFLEKDLTAFASPYLRWSVGAAVEPELVLTCKKDTFAGSMRFAVWAFSWAASPCFCR